jgi:hypothetical protein
MHVLSWPWKFTDNGTWPEANNIKRDLTRWRRPKFSASSVDFYMMVIMNKGPATDKSDPMSDIPALPADLSRA